MYSIQIKNLSKSYDHKKILKNINLNVKEGELLVFVGPSGSGKTTLLKCMADLIDYEGEILRNDEISYVFQQEKLFPHLSAYENIAMGTDFAHAKKEDIEQIAKLVKIEDCLDRKPSQLSGGQAQRVAIARALLEQRKILFMDEPFSNLDPILKEELLDEIKNLHKTLKNTMVYVTHNQEEALSLADRIVVLKDGWIQQVGSPQEIWEHPVNPFVAKFVANMNVIDNFAIHPEDIQIVEFGEEVLVETIEYAGSYKRVKGSYRGKPITIHVPVKMEVKDTIFVHFSEEKIHTFQEENA